MQLSSDDFTLAHPNVVTFSESNKWWFIFSWNFIAMETAWHYSCHATLAPFARSCGEQNKVSKYQIISVIVTSVYILSLYDIIIELFSTIILQYESECYHDSTYMNDLLIKLLVLILHPLSMILQYLVSGPPPPSDNLPGRLSLGIASRLSPKRATVRLSPEIFGDLTTMMDGHFKEWEQMGNKWAQPMVHLTLLEENKQPLHFLRHINQNFVKHRNHRNCQDNIIRLGWFALRNFSTNFTGNISCEKAKIAGKVIPPRKPTCRLVT